MRENLEPKIVDVPKTEPETWDEATWRAVEVWAFAAPARSVNPIVAWVVTFVAILGSSASFGFGLSSGSLLVAMAVATFAAFNARWLDLGRFGARLAPQWVWLPSRYPTNYPPATIESIPGAELPYLPDRLDPFLRRLRHRAERVAREGDHSDALEFIVDGETWRARLFPHGALIASPKARRWLPLCRSRIHLEMAEKLGLPPDILYHARLGGLETLIEMQPDVYARYAAWRGPDDLW